MNLFSNNVRSLFFQHRINPRTQFSRHCHNGDAGAFAAGVSPANRAIKLSKLCILADRRPGRLNQLASKPSVAKAGNRAPIYPISRGVLGWHQAQKASQLPDIVDFTPVSNARQKLASHNPADPRDAHQVGNGLRQFGIFFTEPANLFGTAQHLLFSKLQTVEQLIKLKTYATRARKLSQLSLHPQCPLAAGSSRGKVDAFEQQQGFDPLLVSGCLASHRVAQLRQVTKLAIYRRGNMNAFELSPAQTLGQSSAVKPVGLHSVSWSSGDHRWSGDHAAITVSRKPIIQPVPRRSSLIDKGNPLIGKVLAHVIEQVLHTVRHLQRSDKSMVTRKSRRDTLFTYIQSGKHIILLGYEPRVSQQPASDLRGSIQKALSTAPMARVRLEQYACSLRHA